MVPSCVLLGITAGILSTRGETSDAALSVGDGSPMAWMLHPIGLERFSNEFWGRRPVKFTRDRHYHDQLSSIGSEVVDR